MNILRKTFIIIVSSLIVYFFKYYSVRSGAFLFMKLFEIPIINKNFNQDVYTIVVFEVFLYLIAILLFFLVFKFISNYIKLDKFYLLIVVISPLLFDLSSILYDKSCLKPWYSFEKFIWYFPIHLALWIFLYWFFNDLMVMLKFRKNLILIGLVFLIFHFFKIISRYNF